MPSFPSGSSVVWAESVLRNAGRTQNRPAVFKANGGNGFDTAVRKRLFRTAFMLEYFCAGTIIFVISLRPAGRTQNIQKKIAAAFFKFEAVKKSEIRIRSANVLGSNFQDAFVLVCFENFVCKKFNVYVFGGQLRRFW